MKAISLPINVVVILLLGVIVLIGMVLWFMSVVPSTTTQSTLEAAMRNCCIKWVSLRCDPDFKDDDKCNVPEGFKIAGCTNNLCSIQDIAGQMNLGGQEEKYCGCK